MRLAIVLAIALAAAGEASAHHSFAVFDLSKKVQVEGVVKAYQWTNPHLWLHLVVQADGRAVEYEIEGQSPNMLARKGWSPTSLAPGDKVTVLINPLRTGKPGGALLGVRKSDGASFGQAF
jgi:hypothetical protein